FVSRLFPALAGVFIVVGIPQLLKPWIGRWGALTVSIFLLISPFLLFYSRYIRHDILLIAWVLLAVYAILAYLNSPEDKYLFILAGALALMVSTMEATFIYLAIFAGFLALRLIFSLDWHWDALRHSAEFDLLAVIATLGAFFSSPIALLALNPIWTKLSGAPYVALKSLDTQGVEWASGVTGIRLWALVAVFAAAAVGIGLWWGGKRWLKLAFVFGIIVIPLFTTFFANSSGAATGLIGSLGYWLSQQSVSRGSQPWYYFFIVMPLYEYLPLIGGILAAVYFALRRRNLGQPMRTFVSFALWWAAAIFAAFILAGEKMPWHITHLVTPFILLAGWFAGQLLEHALDRELVNRRLTRALRWTGLAGLAVLTLLTVRTSFLANYVNYDYTTEYIDYAHGAPGVKWALDDIASIAAKTGAGKNLQVAYGNDVSWPMSWYLRDYPNQIFYGADPNRSILDAPVILAGPNEWTKVDTFTRGEYVRYQLIRLWWPNEDYKGLTWERIRYALTDPQMRLAVWDIIWSRDYSLYASLTGQDLNPPVSWNPSESMRVYIRKDIASEIPNLKIEGYRMADLPGNIDAYASVNQPLSAAQLLQPEGINAPRNLTVAADGLIFMLDTGNSRLLKLAPDGTILWSVGSRTPDGQNPPAAGTFNEPWGVAVDAGGNIYVADTWNYRIQKFDPSGKFLLQWGTSGQASDGPDRFWGPRAIAIGPGGEVYVTDTGNKRVVAFDAEGKFLFEFPTTGDARLDEPVGIAVGPGGKVYVADTWNMRVAVFSAKGEYITAWPVEGWYSNSIDNKPYIAVDNQGRVYVTDPEGYRVIVFSPEGKALAAFGQYGPEQGSFGLPNGIALGPDGSVWVADAGNNRLAQYKLALP
ncbi:MAG: TIGR03663 family protein, partial [Chloroflexi bacterium]|nr:TIGR03663 family protein [Chloroflexota bacterium]